VELAPSSTKMDPGHRDEYTEGVKQYEQSNQLKTEAESGTNGGTRNDTGTQNGSIASDDASGAAVEDGDQETSEINHGYSTRQKDRLKEEKQRQRSQMKQKRLNVIAHPRLKPFPFKRLDLMNDASSAPAKVPALTVQNKQFYQSEDHPFNKRGFKYKPCRPNPEFSANLYSTTEIPPYRVRPSYFDRAHDIFFDEEMQTVTTPQGWRSCRSNIGIRGGKYYFEFNIVSANDSDTKGHARIGVARKEASLEAPVGFDGYSYGLRDVQGEMMTLSRPKVSHVENGFTTGDTIGMLVDLPPIEEHRKDVEEFAKSHSDHKNSTKGESVKKKRKTKKPEEISENINFSKHGNVVRDQVPIKYKNSLYYELFEYTNTKVMDHLLNPVTLFGEKAFLENENRINSMSTNIPIIRNGKIRIFKNGVEQKSIENLYSFLPTDIENENVSYNTRQQQNPNYRNTDDGTLGYYPMISVFGGAIVGLNAGPEFKYPIDDDGVKPLSNRYDETVIEEWYWDLVDEVEAEYIDSFDV